MNHIIHRSILSVALALPSSVGFGQQKQGLPRVTPITREVLEAGRARREAGLPRPPLDPEYERHFESFLARIGEFDAARKANPSIEDAAWLLDVLRDEMGHSTLNGRWQHIVVDEIRFAGTRPGTDEDVVELLRSGLFDYIAEGGGSLSPGTEANLARTLAVFGGPGHPECDEQVASLLKHATTWADELQSEIYIGIVRNQRKKIETITKRTYAGLPRARSGPANVAKARQEAERALRALSLGDKPTVEMVEKAARLATANPADSDENEDMIARLLSAYRMVLERRRGASRRVVRAIDERLLWLARDARKLKSERHWSLWADAAAALGPTRASHNLKKYVHNAGRKKTDDAVVRAMRKAERGIRRESFLRVLPVAPTSQPAE